MMDGFEIDMLSLGDADCVLVTGWQGNTGTRILIDGGNKTDYKLVRAFLKQRGVFFINAVVSTHHHGDHSGGLLSLLADAEFIIGNVYAHNPYGHVNQVLVERSLKAATGSSEADSFRKSLETARQLATACYARGITPIEPFAGMNVEFLTIVGPSKEYYEQLLSEFTNAEFFKKIDEQNFHHKIWSLLHDNAVATLDTELPSNPETSPENNSSVIFALLFGTEKFLFTSDAGVPALQRASQQYQLDHLYWMQIPHHGSRRNINPALIKLFSPSIAWVSADGTKKHPRRAVVNAFKQAGTQVYSTHYPTPTNMWQFRGPVPQRAGYGPLVSLYNEVSKTAPPFPPTSTFRNSLLNR